MRVRMVDVTTEAYEVARSYMIRLNPADFEPPALARLAAHAGLSPQAFKHRFMQTVLATTPQNNAAAAVSQPT